MKPKPSPAKDRPADNTSPMFEDVALTAKYSVMDIAKLAAVSRGDTNKDRIKDAVGILSQVERYARLGKEITNQVLRGEKDDSPEDRGKRSALLYSSYNRCFEMSLGICSSAQRDVATGKIERTSLVGLCCTTVNVCEANSSHANRLYLQWLNELAREEGKDFEEIKARYESGTNPVVIHSDNMASVLAIDFLKWLGTRPKRTPPIIRSEKNGEILSPKTRGAEKAEDGKFQAI